jgi:tetratricopeptide (TPR) repeat protein
LAQAAAALRAGLALDPSPFLAWMALGDVLAAEHRPAEALVAYRSALAAYADDQANHVDTFSAPQEGFAMTGLPWNNAGYAVILAHIRAAEQEQNGNGS